MDPPYRDFWNQQTDQTRSHTNKDAQQRATSASERLLFRDVAGVPGPWRLSVRRGGRWATILKRTDFSRPKTLEWLHVAWGDCLQFLFTT